MARRRYQRTGRIYREERKNITWWRIQYWEDNITADGRIEPKRKSERIGPASGPGRMTEKQAQAYAQQHILPRINQNRHKPQSALSVEEFIRRRFIPDFVQRKDRLSTQKHYLTRLENHVIPVIGALPIRDVEAGDIADLVYGVIDSGKSTQTATHVRNICSALFNYAIIVGHFCGENPARLVKAPTIRRRESFAYTWEQCRQLLALLTTPLYEMVFLALTTGLRVGELRGLRWLRINLLDEFVTQGGEAVPPLTLVVREQLATNSRVRDGLHDVKKPRSRRSVPLSAEMVAMLASLKTATAFSGPGHPVFSHGKGVPLNTHNVSGKLFPRLAQRLGFPVSWHVFRHTFSTLVDQVGDVSMADRMAMLGHRVPTVTMDYTHSDMERRRVGISEISGRLTGEHTRVVQ